MEFLKDLNEVQREAATTAEGPLMIIAGAGSGKTRVLTYRIAFLLDQGLCDAFEVLALTFTNKAAREMKERIVRLVGSEARNLWMGTFHSIFARLLRGEAEKIGYTPNFTIYDDDDSESLIKKILKDMNLDDKKFKPRVVMHHISSAKNALVSPTDYALNYVQDEATNIIARIYEKYNARLFDANAMDFDDLLVKPLELFDKYPDTLLKYQRRFKFILVDEYQDTNHAQYTITKKLAALWENICVVGDDAQSIYSFRGANIQNILNFQKDYPQAKVLKLEQNYRSTGHIVEAANSIIARNKHQLQKRVFTTNHEGDLIRVIEATTEQEESKFVTDSIREIIMRQGSRYADFAILYRTNAQSRAIETELRRANVKYRIFGGLSFYKRKEIKDVVAYLKLAINPRDEAALSRVINYPARGIGETTMRNLSVIADEHKLSLWEALQLIQEWKLGARVERPIQDFVTLVKNFGIVAREKTAWEAASYIAKQSGILKELHQDKSIEDLTRWENVQELLNASKEFSENPENDSHTLDAFLAEISLYTDQDTTQEETDYVHLMTIHTSKGLEFPNVFILGLEEDLFPSYMAMQSRADLEEERRLFYVAVTRARDRLTLSHAKSRYKYGQLQFNEPSRFLEEIDPQHLHHSNRRLQPSPGNATVLQSRGNLEAAAAARRKSAGSQPAQFDGDDLTNLAPGMDVQHASFGEGTVKTVEGKGPERKATIFFRDKGQKVLLLKYAKLKILS